MSIARNTKLVGTSEARERAILLLAKGPSRDRGRMRAQVNGLARMYRVIAKADREAPRPREVRKKILKIGLDAQRLRRTLLSIDDFTNHELAEVGEGAPFIEEFYGSYFLTADFAGLWRGRRNKTSDWILRLEALNKVIALTLKNFDYRFPRKGGNKTLFSATLRSARWNLAYTGREIFEAFRPGAALGTDGGDFHQFLMAVFELATGKEGEVHAKLLPYVKHVSKFGRQLSQAQEETSRLRTELEEIRQSGTQNELTEMRVQRILQRLSELQSLRVKYYAALWNPSR